MAELAFGRYQVVGELGRGAMAVVYLAEDTVLQRKVAVKALTSLIEPMLIVFLGGIVGFIVGAVMVPMFQLINAIQK